MNDDAFFANLQRIDLGNGVAEYDNLLWTCMVQTQHFTDLLYDRIDLVLGSKGSGKSSLFRMFGEILENLLFEKWQTIVVSGVETKGDPIFKSYSEHFQQFSESQFETFWKAYLLSLVYNEIFHEPRTNAIFAPHAEELASFRKFYHSLGLIDIGRVTSPTRLLKLVCAFTIAAVEGAKFAWDMEKNQLVLGVNIREKLREGYEEVAVPNLTTMDTVLCVTPCQHSRRPAATKFG